VILGEATRPSAGRVRIGTAEIYRQVERLAEVVESLVIGQEWEGDVRIVLTCSCVGTTLDETLCDRIRRRIRAPATMRRGCGSRIVHRPSAARSPNWPFGTWCTAADENMDALATPRLDLLQPRGPPDVLTCNPNYVIHD
jgi:hypothetical protein